MGYETRYWIELTHEEDGDISKIVAAFQELDEDVIEWVLDFDLSCYQPAKWYNHNVAMIEISKRFPHILFELHGEGETNEDIWVEYYQNGKYYHDYAIITFPPFDPTKMKG